MVGIRASTRLCVNLSGVAHRLLRPLAWQKAIRRWTRFGKVCRWRRRGRFGITSVEFNDKSKSPFDGQNHTAACSPEMDHVEESLQEHVKGFLERLGITSVQLNAESPFADLENTAACLPEMDSVEEPLQEHVKRFLERLGIRSFERNDESFFDDEDQTEECSEQLDITPVRSNTVVPESRTDLLCLREVSCHASRGLLEEHERTRDQQLRTYVVVAGSIVVLFAALLAFAF